MHLDNCCAVRWWAYFDNAFFCISEKQATLNNVSFIFYLDCLDCENMLPRPHLYFQYLVITYTVLPIYVILFGKNQ